MKMATAVSPTRRDVSRDRTVLDALLEDLAGLELPVEPHERPREVQVPLREVRLQFYYATSVVRGAVPPRQSLQTSRPI